MSFNPFRKKNPAPEEAGAGVPAGQESISQDGAGTGDSASPQGAYASTEQNSDRTDPLGDMHVEPAAVVLRDGPGGRVEQVQLGEERFLRLTVSDPQRAELLRPLLLDLPEQATGFRDLLVAEAAPLAAAFDLPESDLGSLVGGAGMTGSAGGPARDSQAGTVARPTNPYRSVDILSALVSIATVLSATAQHGLVWSDPSASLIGLMSEQVHRAAGFRRWRATFTGWDLLAPGDEAQAARQLVTVCIPALDGLLTQANAAGFRHAHLPLAQLLGQLEELSQSVNSYAQLASAVAALASASPSLYAATDTGRRREHNEDAYALLTLEQASVAGSRFALAAVADGMGGHNSGEIASSLALDLLRTHISQLALSPRISWQSTPAGPAGSLGQYVTQIIPAIGRALNERAALDTALGGMGTTLAGYAQLTPQSTTPDFAPPPAQGAVFWVGDSRAYLLSAAGLQALSTDHSYVQSLLDQGQVTSDEAFSHPQKNIITRCLGGSGQDDRPEVAPFMLGPGEQLLLCSDGLTDALREADIWRIVCGVDSAEPADIARALIDSANAAGGPDNITVVLVSA